MMSQEEKEDMLIISKSIKELYDSQEVLKEQIELMANMIKVQSETLCTMHELLLIKEQIS